MNDSVEIAKNVQVGKNFVVWSNSEIRENVIIGNNVSVGRNVYIAPDVIIGDGTRIQNNVCIYENSRIGKNVLIGPGSILTNDRLPRLVDEHGQRRTKGNWTPLGVVLSDNSSLGAHVTCVSGITVGEWAIIGAGSVVAKSIPNYALAYGNPARVKRRVGEGGVFLDSVDGHHYFSRQLKMTYELSQDLLGNLIPSNDNG